MLRGRCMVFKKGESLVDYLVLLIAALIGGTITAMIAFSKGRSVVGWFVFGCLLAIVAIPAILIAYPMGKDCPECAERVKEEALKCRYCGHVFVTELTEAART